MLNTFCPRLSVTLIYLRKAGDKCFLKSEELDTCKLLLFFVSHAQYIINYLAFIIYETSSSQHFLLRNSGRLFVITGKHISL